MRHERHYGDRMVRCFVERPKNAYDLLQEAVARNGAGEAIVALLDTERNGKKRINGPPPQPTLPAVRHAVVELIARLPPQRCPHCRKWICREKQRE
jgi:hypothetical protein